MSPSAIVDHSIKAIPSLPKVGVGVSPFNIGQNIDNHNEKTDQLKKHKDEINNVNIK